MASKSYKCQYCQKIYAYSQRLKTHIKVIHFGLKQTDDQKVEESVKENPTTTINLGDIPLIQKKTDGHEGKNSDGFG